jgi:hypothetical protein
MESQYLQSDRSMAAIFTWPKKGNTLKWCLSITVKADTSSEASVNSTQLSGQAMRSQALIISSSRLCLLWLGEKTLVSFL